MVTPARHGRKRTRDQEWIRESEGPQGLQRMPFPARKGPILDGVKGRENRNLCHVVESREMQLENSRCTVACQRQPLPHHWLWRMVGDRARERGRV